MKPPRDRCREGRANPKGITYLYLATDRDTALAEVRPWIGSLLSVGQFKTLRALQFVNCTTDEKAHRIYIGKEPSPSEREECVWADIDRAFAKPVDPSDDLADYTPTQVLPELFKTSGFDGIAYRSSLGPGHNITLFDVDAAELVNCFLFTVENLKFKFREAANPYFMTKRDETGDQ
ncbi:MAG: RES family NAD+ phosphorylase [Candidatus Binatia bacterium]